MGVDSQRILIFGGTFDPPHLAHAKLPALAAGQLDCDHIVYIPARLNPLKRTQPTDADHRLNMLLLTLADVPNAEISTFELDHDGPSYTVDTLEHLKRAYGDAELSLLMGSDNVMRFHEWKDWQRILQLATPAVMLRPPMTRQQYERTVRETFDEAEAERWVEWVLDLPAMDISASDIRAGVHHADSPLHQVTPEVADYIRRHDLYTAAAAR